MFGSIPRGAAPGDLNSQQLCLDKAQPPPRAARGWCPQPGSAAQPSPRSLQQLHVNPLNSPCPRQDSSQVGMGSQWPGWLQLGAVSPIIPTAPLPGCPTQESNGRAGAAVASAAQLLWLPVLFYCSLGWHSGRCARLMGAGRDSLPGPGADKGEAGQSSSLLRMNL